jgi:hypothetical protein
MWTNRWRTIALGPACAALVCCSDEGESPDAPSAVTDALPELPSPAAAEPGSRPVSETGICNNLLSASDIPFATAVFAISDACPSQRRSAPPLPSLTVADVRRSAPGNYCASGMLLEGGFAYLLVSFDHINDRPAPPFHGPLDAPAFGITSVRFTLESPPATGLRVSASNVVDDICPFSSDECIQGGFYVLGETGEPITMDQPGTYTQRLADFQSEPGLSATLDVTRFAGIALELNPGAFDVCVSGVQLLDEAGRAVPPPG